MHPELVVKNYVEKLVMIEKMATKIRAEDNAVLWKTFAHSQSQIYFTPCPETELNNRSFQLTNKQTTS